MKKLLYLSLLISFSLHAQDTITIKHKLYTTTFDRTKHYPVLVHWELTSDQLECTVKLKRSNKFTSDPKIGSSTNLNKDYAGSKYDRGHNMDASDNSCDATGEIECFYYSNMTPQLPALNRGNWKRLEEYCRKLAIQDGDIEIWCGSFGHIDNIGPDSVWVPAFCWKVIKDKKDGHIEAYKMPNDIHVNDYPFDYYKVDVKELSKLTGFNL